MQEDSHEMGQTLLELLHVRPLAWLWVGLELRLCCHVCSQHPLTSPTPLESTRKHHVDSCDSCAVMLATEAAPWYQQNAPGLIRTISAIFFPVGLIMIVLSGSDLFTSNVMVPFSA